MFTTFIAGYVGTFTLMLLFVAIIARKLGVIICALLLLAILAGVVCG